MKYRKKPVIVEAKQWSNSKPVDGVCTLDDLDHSTAYYPHIHTLEGVMIVSEGDWIIIGVQGEVYPCKPAIFEATYEILGETDV